MIVLLTGLLVTSLVAGCGSKQPTGGGLTTHTIVGIFPLTGVLSTFGENSAEVAKLAASDVNAWLEKEGKNWRL